MGRFCSDCGRPMVNYKFDMCEDCEEKADKKFASEKPLIAFLIKNWTLPTWGLGIIFIIGVLIGLQI